MSSRMYKPRGSPRASRGTRRQTVNRYRASSRGAMYSHIRRTGRTLGRARSLGLKNARTGGLLGVETKYFDTSLASSQINLVADCTSGEQDPATVLCLNGVPQGDTASSRDGFKIAMKSIQIDGIVRLDAQANQTAADQVPYVFIALVLDTQTNGAQLNSEDVFSNPAADSQLAACPLRNMSYTERFKVLKIKKARAPQVPMTYDGTNIEQQGTQIPFSMFVKLGGLQTKFQSGTTTGYVGTIVDNSLHLIAYVNNSALIPVISYNARLRYIG